jgi:DNA-binding GntR family transcriptional regulator
MAETIGEDNAGSSLSARVFLRIQQDILKGTFKSGERLAETKLSDLLGVSRTPIREALKQLELEGLVKVIPNKGAIVTGVSIKDISDVYTIRKLIEGLAARWAAENITQEELDVLSETVALEQLYIDKNDAGHLSKYDSMFHDTLFLATKSNPLNFMLKTFHMYVQRSRNSALAVPERARMAHNEHKAILDALVARDPDRAEKLMTEHISNASRYALKKI